MPEKKWTKTDQARAESRERWIVESEAVAIPYWAEARAAFTFLTRKYSFYGPTDEKIDGVSDGRDTIPMISYHARRMDVVIGWFITSQYIYVQFRLPPINNLVTEPEREARRTAPTTYMDLYALARYLGKADDPDFMLGDVWNLYESASKKRQAIIDSNRRGVVEGLARATERYASHVLTGDYSQFSDVAAYYETHRDDYIRGQKKA
jgi:hypothetical protein